MAAEMQVTCYVKHFQTIEHSKSERISAQMAARNLRYAWFEELRLKERFDFIAVGHNSDDVVETILLNLSRGTGIKGLTGIRQRQRYIIRPLLFASRGDIHSFALQNGIAWRDDASNADTKYHRNALRHDVIPRLEKIYPAFRQNVIHTASHLDQATQLLELTLEDIRKKISTRLPDRVLIDVEKLAGYPAVETVLFELLRDFGCNASMVRSLTGLISGESGKRILTGSHTITRDRQYMIITENASLPADNFLIQEGTTSLAQPLRMDFNTADMEGFVIPSARKKAALDMDQVDFPLTLRRWKHGDHFRPLGLKGKKKISDYLIDQKISLPDKQQTWVLLTGERIMWLVDHRIDDRFKIRKHTKHILLIEHLDESDHG
jgi:tRNA(Ile)-lysidine synthase